MFECQRLAVSFVLLQKFLLVIFCWRCLVVSAAVGIALGRSVTELAAAVVGVTAPIALTGFQTSRVSTGVCSGPEQVTVGSRDRTGAAVHAAAVTRSPSCTTWLIPMLIRTYASHLYAPTHTCVWLPILWLALR